MAWDSVTHSGRQLAPCSQVVFIMLQMSDLALAGWLMVMLTDSKPEGK